MKLLILSLLASGAMSAAVGEAGLKVKRSTACNCDLFFGRDRVTSNYVATSPGLITVNAFYATSDNRNHLLVHPGYCRVTWDRGNNPTDCSTWKQYAGPNGGPCPRSIQQKTNFHCGGID
ncbi:uncharacterized protein RAG0_01892 [Rhynchosporium agropyri]|uniref:Uncharacterized protein n=1 Tax=Rhynchosporium agropyri TaxID=914238 RepID=A0A1E1JZ44_9HELO|nr:uncharacterized protein RAG0_01892 [Rhynchosporium agropyri]